MAKTTKSIVEENLNEKEFVLTSTIAGVDVTTTFHAKFDATENEWWIYSNENVDLSESDLKSLYDEIKKLNT